MDGGWLDGWAATSHTQETSGFITPKVNIPSSFDASLVGSA
jgi:hypothetical protein